MASYYFDFGNLKTSSMSSLCPEVTLSHELVIWESHIYWRQIQIFSSHYILQLLAASYLCLLWRDFISVEVIQIIPYVRLEVLLLIFQMLALQCCYHRQYPYLTNFDFLFQVPLNLSMDLSLLFAIGHWLGALSFPCLLCVRLTRLRLLPLRWPIWSSALALVNYSLSGSRPCTCTAGYLQLSLISALLPHRADSVYLIRLFQCLCLAQELHSVQASLIICWKSTDWSSLRSCQKSQSFHLYFCWPD